MDAYKAWLQERIDWFTDWCLKDAAKIGYPGKIKFAEQSMRYSLEAYEECLEQYEALSASPALPDPNDVMVSLPPDSKPLSEVIDEDRGEY